MTAEAARPDLAAVTLGAFPYYENNAWQRVVYAGIEADGGEIDRLSSPEFDVWADAVRARGRVPVLHVNWTAAVSQAATDVRDSWLRVETAITALRRLRAEGVAILWTVHNVLPHDPAYLVPELRLCRALAELADTILIMNPRTPEAVSPWYRLPAEKLRRIPLASYVGEYPDRVSREEARARLGLDPDAPMLLNVGTLRPYKGIEELIAAVPALQARHAGLRVVITGEIGPGYTRAALEARSAGVAGLELHTDYVPDDELQWWFRAADAMVLPYRAGLNSGALLLAAGFGLPVIMTDSDAAVEVAGEPWVHVVASDGPLEDGISAGLTALAANPEAGALARAFAETRAPGRVAAAFSAELARTLGQVAGDAD